MKAGIPQRRIASAESGQTGSGQSTMMGTGSAFCSNDTKAAASNGPGPVKRHNRYPNNSFRWLLERLNPEQPKAVQKWHPKQAKNL